MAFIFYFLLYDSDNALILWPVEKHGISMLFR